MLIEAVRRTVADESALGFRIAGDDFVSLTLEDVRAVNDACSAAVASVPLHLKSQVEDQLRAHARETHSLLRQYNAHIADRVRGYLALGRMTGFELPWPIIAGVGVTQIVNASLGFHVVASVAECLRRLGAPSLAEQTAQIDDVTRRANRAIFTDSATTLLFAYRCAKLRRQGRDGLADALLSQPFALTMDAESLAAARSLDEAFRIDDGAERFQALARVSRRLFDREQAVFGYHMGDAFVPRGVPRWLKSRLRARTTGAPAFVETARGLQLTFVDRPLPSDFDWTDHRTRVELMERLFCDAITRSEDHFRCTVAFLTRRYEPGRLVELPAFDRGGVPFRDD